MPSDKHGSRDKKGQRGKGKEKERGSARAGSSKISDDPSLRLPDITYEAQTQQLPSIMTMAQTLQPAAPLHTMPPDKHGSKDKKRERGEDKGKEKGSARAAGSSKISDDPSLRLPDITYEAQTQQLPPITYKAPTQQLPSVMTMAQTQQLPSVMTMAQTQQLPPIMTMAQTQQLPPIMTMAQTQQLPPIMTMAQTRKLPDVQSQKGTTSTGTPEVPKTERLCKNCSTPISLRRTTFICKRCASGEIACQDPAQSICPRCSSQKPKEVFLDSVGHTWRCCEGCRQKGMQSNARTKERGRQRKFFELEWV
ncbi:hypothetical protein F4779DRAFT_224228 [Xylariaceae sp. FL0662B]|nr:hypothetical protein F4779DRAFT_224228 [Xylariaceae sp. FL0662B]